MTTKSSTSKSESKSSKSESKDTGAREEPVDNTEEVLRSFGITGEPVTWAPEPWQPLVAVIRSYNRGFGQLSTVQDVLDTTFAEAGKYDAAAVVLSGAPTAGFAATADGMDVAFAAADSGLALPDDCYVWAFGDGETGSGASTSHTYADPGEYTVRLSQSVAGASYSSEETVTVDTPEVTPQEAEGKGRKRATSS